MPSGSGPRAALRPSGSGTAQSQQRGALRSRRGGCRRPELRRAGAGLGHHQHFRAGAAVSRARRGRIGREVTSASRASPSCSGPACCPRRGRASTRTAWKAPTCAGGTFLDGFALLLPQLAVADPARFDAPDAAEHARARRLLRLLLGVSGVVARASRAALCPDTLAEAVLVALGARVAGAAHRRRRSRSGRVRGSRAERLHLCRAGHRVDGRGSVRLHHCRPGRPQRSAPRRRQ